MINKNVGLRFYDVVNIDLFFKAKYEKNSYFEKMLLILLNKWEFGGMNEDINKIVVNNLFDLFREDCLSLRKANNPKNMVNRKRPRLGFRPYRDLKYDSLLVNKMFVGDSNYFQNITIYYNGEKYTKYINKKHEGYEVNNDKLCMLFPRVKSDI